MSNEQHGYSINETEFRLFRELVYRETGINLVDGKKLLLVTRLSKRLKQLRLQSFLEYYEYLKGAGAANREMTNLINLVTTNKTDFFREKHHFDFLSTSILPELKAAGQRNIRIWSAGCSTGEEPYSIAITVKEFFEREIGFDIKILATDLDTNVLAKAEAGVYDEDRLLPVPEPLRRKYSQMLPDRRYEMKKNLKNLITFRQLNLMQPKLPFKYGFDVVFCRNVIIYFTKPDRQRLLTKIHGVIRENGYLILGHSESLIADTLGFQSLANTIYRKK